MNSTFLKKKFADRYLNYFLILVGIIFLLAELKRVSDFGIFLQASKDLALGKDIYQIWYGVGFRYYYSPLFALLLRPLTLLPPYLAASLWSVLSMILLIRTIALLHAYVPRIENRGRLNLLLVICTSALLYANFHNNQMTAFLLWAIIECIEQFRKGRWILGSFILALGINIKLLPIVLVPYLVYRTKYKAAVLTILFMVIFWLVPAVFIGWDYNMKLLHSYWNYINPTLKQNVIDIDEPGLLSISSLVTTWFTDQFSINELGYRRHFIVLPNQMIGYLILLVRLCIIFFALHFLKWPPFHKARSRTHELWELSFLCLVTPLIFPHQQNYGFVLILPAVFYILYSFKSDASPARTWQKWLFVFSVLLINAGLLFGPYKFLFWNYKVLTYGVLMLGLIIAFLSPLKEKES